MKKPPEREITIMYGDGLLERGRRKIPTPRSLQIKKNVRIAAIVVALVAAGLAIGYIHPLVDDQQLPQLIQRDVHIGESKAAVKLFLKLRFMDSDEYGGDAAAASFDDAKEREESGCPGFVGDLSQAQGIATVVSAQRTLANGQPSVSATFFFDDHASLAGYRIKPSGSDGGKCSE